MDRRVVITGIGVISPLGLDAPSTWRALLAGQSGVGPITRFDATDYPCRIAAEVRGFDPEDHLERKEARKMDTFSHYAIAASREAIDDARLVIDAANADRVGVCIGSGIGGLGLLERTHRDLLDRGPRRISPFFIPGMIVNLAAGQVSILFGARGPNLALATACATGTHAIGESICMIREGRAEAMIAGGTEAVVTPLAVSGFCAMKALSTRNDEPERASRPFDAERDGFVMGEGAGIVVLEERARALARGARIYAEVAGYGVSGDAYHVSAPDPDGSGAVRAMRAALRDASCDPKEVDYINAHGTSTPIGDRVETLAVKEVFGGHARELAFASTKSMTGHLLGAAGGVETAVAALVIHHGEAPPTINQTAPDPDCDLDSIPNRARALPVRAALNNSFGFGGTNAALLLRRDEGRT
jgi:3-oxoacyl-[acyl-carrier-protein] synthase II